MHIARVAVAVASLAASSAVAEDDDPTRLSDTFFYGVYGGAARSTAAHFSRSGADGIGRDVEAPYGPVGWAAGFSLGVWPRDWVGVDFAFDAFDASLGRIDFDRCPAPPCEGTYGGTVLRIGPSLRLALPLRYVAPYVGAGPEAHVALFGGKDAQGEFAGGLTPQLGFRLFAGINFYLTRDVRLFADWQALHTSGSVALHAGKKTDDDSAGLIAFEDLSPQVISLGFAYTPDDFRASPSKSYWVALPLALSALAFGFGVLATLP
jgi:hypothetical protein